MLGLQQYQLVLKSLLELLKKVHNVRLAVWIMIIRDFVNF